MSTNTFKFITVKDPHLRLGFPKPLGRTDSFFDDMQKKWDEITRVAREEEINYLLIPGDVFDRKDPSGYTLVSLSRIEEFLRNAFAPFYKVYTIPGNHDLPNSSLDNKDRSVYNFFSSRPSGSLYTDLTDATIWESGVSITGIGYRSIPETFSLLGEINSKLDPENYNIVMLHVNFAPFGETLEYIDFRNYQSLWSFDRVDTFLMGHNHHGYPVYYDVLPNGRTQHYINLWNMTRLVRNYYSVGESHVPQYAVVEVNLDDHTTNVDVRDLPHKPYKDAFVEADVLIEKTFHGEVSEFVKELKSLSSSGEDLSDIPEKYRSVIMEYLEKAEKEDKHEN